MRKSIEYWGREGKGKGKEREKKKKSLRSPTINLLQDRKLQRQKVDKCLMIKTEGKI